MAATKANGHSDEFNPAEYTKKVQDLEDFKSEFEGTKFYEKVDAALKGSTHVQSQIKVIFWCAFKEKIGWFLLGAIVLIALDLGKDLVGHLISKI